MIIEKDVQKRILKAILDNGGTANTKEIMDASNLNRSSVNHGSVHLFRRALIKESQRRRRESGVIDNNIYTLTSSPRLLEKIKRIISEIRE